MCIRDSRAAVAAVLFTGAVAAAVVLLQNNMWLRPVSDLADKTVYLEGRVTEIEHGSGNSRYRREAVIPLQDSAKPVKANGMVYSFISLSADVNDVLRGYVSLYNPKLEGKYRYRYLADRLLLFGTFHGKIEAVDQMCIRDSADSPGGPYTTGALEGIYSASGMKEAASLTGAKLNFDTGWREVKCEDYRVCSGFNIIDPVAGADLVVNLPKLKTHCITTVSYTHLGAAAR